MTKVIKTVIIGVIKDIFKELDKPNPDTTYVKSLLSVILTVLK